MNGDPLLAYRSFYMPLNTLSRFHKAGYDTGVLFPAHTVNSRGTPYSQYKPTWLWFDRLDFDPVDKMIHDFTVAMPGVKFICMVDLNSPQWLEHMNATTPCDSFNQLGKVIHEKNWREPTEKYLLRFLQHMEENYGERVTAYVLACGATDEWYDYSLGTESHARREAWRQWCLNRGLADPVDIPPESIRFHFEHENTLRDPKIDAVSLQYWRFCNESIAGAINRFAALARTVIRSEIDLGFFYGYILEKGRSEMVTCGHLAYEMVLDSPDINFLIGPGTYHDRAIGGGSGFLIPNGSARVRGKRLLHECDQRTYCYNPFLTADITLPYQHWPDEKSTIAGLKREAALALIKNTSLWWFDMWGDYYQGEAVMQTLAQIRELWSCLSGKPKADVCECAVFVDAASCYYLNDQSSLANVNRRTLELMNRTAMPYEIYSIYDLPRIAGLDRYKFFIFTTPFEIDADKLALLERYVFNNQRYVLWYYAPGISNGAELNVRRCEEISGISYGASGLQTCDRGQWTSCCIDDFETLTTGMLRQLAKAAGVHVYAEPEVPIFAGGNLLAVHCAGGGLLELKIPGKYRKATEWFTGKTYVVEAGTLCCQLQDPDTLLLVLE